MPPATTTSCGRPESSFCRFLALGNSMDVIGDPTLAGAILDRLVHNAYKRRAALVESRMPTPPIVEGLITIAE